jgi:hypothetical protein
MPVLCSDRMNAKPIRMMWKSAMIEKAGAR